MAAEESTPSAPLGRVGRYELTAHLASGGMATVFLGQLKGPHGFEKVVAVKKIHPHLGENSKFVEMFLDEARVAARLQHPNVCGVTDFGVEEGTPYLVMEYLHGESLHAMLQFSVAERKYGLPAWLAGRIVHDAARGLHAAHELVGSDGLPLHVIHRDVSPQNVFVTYDGVTKVVDFGVAKARGRLVESVANEVKGKFSYMAPEQLVGGDLDCRVDVWALGVVLSEAVTGRRLFRASDPGRAVFDVLNKEIPPLSKWVQDPPPRLQEIVTKALQREKDKRYASAKQLADDLEEFLYGLGRPSGASQVANWFTENYADRIESRKVLVSGVGLPAAVENPAQPGKVSSEVRVTHVARALGIETSVKIDDEVVAAEEVPGDKEGATRVSPHHAHLETVHDQGTAVAPREYAAAAERQGGPAPVELSAPKSPTAPPATKPAQDEQETVWGMDVPASERAGRTHRAEGSVPALDEGRQAATTAEGRPRKLGAAVLGIGVLGVVGILAVGVGLGWSVRSESEQDGPRVAGAPPITLEVAPGTQEPEASLPAPAAAPPAAVVPEVATGTPEHVEGALGTAGAADHRESSMEAGRTGHRGSHRSRSGGVGTISLLAVPSAAVTMDGRSLGRTPLVNVEVPAGSHRFLLRAADGREKEVDLTVVAGETLRRRIEF